MHDLIAVASQKYGHDYAYDVSLNQKLMNIITQKVRSRVKDLGITMDMENLIN